MVTQDKVAFQPEATIVLSLINRKVSWPVALVAVKMVGLVVPVNTLINGEEVLGPSYTKRMS